MSLKMQRTFKIKRNQPNTEWFLWELKIVLEENKALNKEPPAKWLELKIVHSKPVFISWCSKIKIKMQHKIKVMKCFGMKAREYWKNCFRDLYQNDISKSRLG